MPALPAHEPAHLPVLRLLRTATIARAPRWPLLAAALALLVALATAFSVQPAHAAPGDHVPAVDFNLDSANGKARSIVWTGNYHYVIEEFPETKIFAYDGTGAYTPAADIDLAFYNTNPGGIAWDGTYLVVPSRINRKVYAYGTDGTVASNNYFELTSDNTHPHGIVWDGTYFRVVDNHDDKVYAYTSSGTYTPTEDFNLTSDHTDPFGITKAGSHFYIGDRSDDKVYAYTSSGTYASSADFNLTSANGDLRGIATDESYFYVVDRVDDKVFAYEGPDLDAARTDATLISLSLTAGTLSPGFSADVTEYTATVPNSVTSINVSATPTQDGATETGTGTHDLSFPINAVSVTVTSPNGLITRTYNIAITREGVLAPTFDANGVLATPVGTVVDSSLTDVDCFLFPSGQHVVVTVFNEEAKPIGVCWSSSLLYWLFPSGTPDFDSSIASAISFEADLREGSASSFKRSEDNGALLATSTANTVTVSGTTYDYSQSASLTAVSGAISNLAVDDAAHLRLEITDDRTVDDFSSNADADIPDAPDELLASRNAAYDVATVSWHLVGPVVEYQIEREQAITVQAAQTASTQYGNTVRYLVPGTVWGVDEYADGTVDPRYTYRYRIRARRGTDWGDWSAYIISVGEPSVDLDAPGAFEVARALDNSQVILNWTAPTGEITGYTVQRQELAVVEGSSIFANTRTLSILSSSTLTYTDTSIAPGRTYEYRVAATHGGDIGDYTEWARATPFERTFGQAARNFHLTESDVTRAGRREYWLAWDAIQGADDYVVEIEERAVPSGDTTMSRNIVTDRMYFHTAFTSAQFRVRGRMQDDNLCGPGTDDRCLSPWTPWLSVNFAPPPAPVLDPVTPVAVAADAGTIELRNDLEGIIDEGLNPLGGNHNAALMLNALTLVIIFVVASAAYILGHRRGMAPAGFAAAIGISVVLMALGQRLLHIPEEWLIVTGAVILVGGGAATIRSYAASRG